MIQAFPMRERGRWTGYLLILLGLLLLSTRSLSDSVTVIGAVVFLTAGSWRERIFIDEQGILYDARLLFVIPIRTRCLFKEADRLDLVPMKNGRVRLDWLKGRKLKRILIEGKDERTVRRYTGL